MKEQTHWTRILCRPLQGVGEEEELLVLKPSPPAEQMSELSLHRNSK